MAITYTWKITSLEKMAVGTFDGFVSKIYWKKIGIDSDKFMGEFSRSTTFTPAINADPATFVKFEDLRESNILEWVKQGITEEYETYINNQIQAHINLIKNPITEVQNGNIPPVTL